MTRLLVTAVGRRRYVVQELLTTACAGDQLYVSDASSTAPALGVPGVISVLSPTIDQDPYCDWVRAFCRENAIDAVLSLHDHEILALSACADPLEKAGTQFIGPSHESAQILLDKLAFYRHIVLNTNALTPPTSRLSDLRNGLVHGLKEGVPLIVKDRLGSGSSGLQILSNVASILTALTSGRDSTDELVVQPLLEGTEYNVDLFISQLGEIRASAVKRKIRMRGGETDAAEVLPSPPLDVLASAADAMLGLSACGNIDVDVMVHEGIPYVLDVNPRFGGGYAYSRLAGYPGASYTWLIAKRASLPEQPPALAALRGAKYIDVASIPNRIDRWR